MLGIINQTNSLYSFHFTIGIRDRLDKNSYVECPHAGCIQEITHSHRLTPEMQLRNKVVKYQATNPSFVSLSTVPEGMVVIRPKECATNDNSKQKPDNTSSFTPVKINLPGLKASSESPTTEACQKTDSLENIDDTLSIAIDQKDRSRSRSRTTTTSTRASSKASRSRSTSSSTSHGTIKSTSSASRSEQTPNLNTTPVTDEVADVVPAAPVCVPQSNVVAPIQQKTSQSQYYNPSMSFNQQMVQQQQFGNTAPHFGNTAPQFYNQQQSHMGQGFYNQQYDTNYRFLLFHGNFRPVDKVRHTHFHLPIGYVCWKIEKFGDSFPILMILICQINCWSIKEAAAQRTREDIGCGRTTAMWQTWWKFLFFSVYFFKFYIAFGVYLCICFNIFRCCICKFVIIIILVIRFHLFIFS